MAQDAVEKWTGRVLICCHVREILSQLAETIRRIWPMAPVGIYSAGLNSRDTTAPIIVGGIQSIYQRACDLGRFNLLIIDEVHLLPAHDEGMYRKLLADLRVINPDLCVVGLTATPFRLDSGYIYGEGRLFARVCYEAHVRPLIDQGYLCNLRGKDGGKPDLSEVHRRGGEYIPAELEAVMSDEQKITTACDDAS